MIAVAVEPSAVPECGTPHTAAGDIIELTLLLPRDHFFVLEYLAEAKETVVARLLRQVISDFLVRELRLDPKNGLHFSTLQGLQDI